MSSEKSERMKRWKINKGFARVTIEWAQWIAVSEMKSWEFAVRMVWVMSSKFQDEMKQSIAWMEWMKELLLLFCSEVSEMNEVK